MGWFGTLSVTTSFFDDNNNKNWQHLHFLMHIVEYPIQAYYLILSLLKTSQMVNMRNDGNGQDSNTNN
jgi:hypothetical protein